MRTIFVLTLLLSMTTVPLLGMDGEEKESLFSYIHHSIGGGMHDDNVPYSISQYEKKIVRFLWDFCKYVYKRVDESVGSGKYGDSDDDSDDDSDGDSDDDDSDDEPGAQSHTERG